MTELRREPLRHSSANPSGYVRTFNQPPGTLGGVVDFTHTPPPHDARSAWLRFALIVTGSAVGGFGVSLLACYGVARIVAKSVEDHLRCLTVTPAE